MEIRSESRIIHSREVVYLAYRDRMPDATPYLSDVKEIRVCNREELDGVVVLHNEWISDRDVPGFAKKILKPEHLCWDDFATWSDSTHRCEWRLRTRAFTEAVHCFGQTTFHDNGDGTTMVRVVGDLKIDLVSIPGVPGFLAKRLAPQVEKFIVSLITPNLETTNVAIGRYLDDQA